MQTRFSVTLPHDLDPVLRQYANDSGLTLSAALIALASESLGLDIPLPSPGRPVGSKTINRKSKQEQQEDEQYAF
jgi:hypothetical protein